MATAKSPAAVPAKKAKKASAPKSRNPPQHPPYFEMIKDAIVTLKERTGSSPQAIAKFIEGKYKDLPANYKKLLSVQLKKNVADCKLVKVKASFKLPPKNAPATADSSAPVKKAKAPAKPVAKKAPAKKKAVATPTKAKATAKLKVKASASKAKPAAKPKAAAATKAKPAAKPAAKSAKTSTRSTPGRTAGAAKPAVKKTPVKKVAAKKTAAPKKAAAGSKKGKK
ncbi:hypothetical protein L1987_29147 [Smallanthus sonchifolius]|uniref:Uncharacterized protein n=1 Tax=Smallanthus sonchifolius TaxID=185202 RepID=A0ACB9I0E4_9ASTR|nr:hypothetical protein L1987_29147 [Smallanthus sonchifolius]